MSKDTESKYGTRKDISHTHTHIHEHIHTLAHTCARDDRHKSADTGVLGVRASVSPQCMYRGSKMLSAIFSPGMMVDMTNSGRLKGASGAAAPLPPREEPCAVVAALQGMMTRDQQAHQAHGREADTRTAQDMRD